MAYHVVGQIIIFYNTTLSSYVMYQCSKHHILISYISSYGTYYGSFIGSETGNVLLRKKQFDMIGSDAAVNYVRNLIGAKLYNSVWLLSYFGHHNDNKDAIRTVIARLRSNIDKLRDVTGIDDMRILEANSASEYFSVFDLLLKTDDINMSFNKRTKRPPLNNTNALLSFLYTIATNFCCSALLCRGLDPECGYLHTLRSGRNSLACDLIEEFRACIIDRFVISIINRKEIVSTDFEHGNDGIRLIDTARKKLLQKWEIYLDSTFVQHRLYDKKLSLRVLFYEQAQLLAQYIRGDISKYPPFLMK